MGVTEVGVGVAFSLSLVAPPGPMNAVIAEETVFRGWLSGFVAGLGALVSDGVFFALSVLGFTVLISRSVRLILLVSGGVLMLYLGYDAYRSSRRNQEYTDGVSKSTSQEEVPTRARSFVKAFGVGVTNPYQITWWLTVGVTLLTETSLDLLGREFVVGGSEVIAGFFAGILLWITVFPALLILGRGRRRFDEVVGYTSSFLLILFGAVFVYSALSRVGA